jgi:predicted RNase H-like HicB family nuclease
MRKPTRSPATARSFTAVVHRDGDMYVASCPELDVVSQGRTVEVATANLKEAVELFLECADAKEVRRRLRDKVFVTRFETVRG